MEAQYQEDRARLRYLLKYHPHWTNRDYAEDIGRSPEWVKKWKKRLTATPSSGVIHRQSSARHRPPEKIAPEVVKVILEIRDNPPQNLQRTPGPVTIRYYLEQDQQLKAAGHRLPRSTRTIWRILKEAGRIASRPVVVHEPWELVEPLTQWQIDFKSVSSVPPDPDGKKQHVVETLNVIDKGTSILLESLPASDYTAETVILALAHTLLIHGLPEQITFDRDPRFVGAALGSDFPSAMLRFLWCLGIRPDVCPPQRPDKNAYVERFHLSYDRECLHIHRPTTLEQVRDVTQQCAIYPGRRQNLFPYIVPTLNGI